MDKENFKQMNSILYSDIIYGNTYIHAYAYLTLLHILILHATNFINKKTDILLEWDASGCNGKACAGVALPYRRLGR